MDRETLFFTKLREVKLKILSSTPAEVIREELDLLIKYTRKHFKDLDFLKKLDLIIDTLLIERVLKDKTYITGLLNPYLNIYTTQIKSDFYTSWSLIFAKILSGKINYLYPAVLSAIFKVHQDHILGEYTKEEVSFPLEETADLAGFLSSTSEILLDILTNSSSYTLFSSSLLRNSLVMYLYELYRSSGSLTIWMPCAGIGIEPLQIAYTLGLLHEAQTGKTAMKGFTLYCSDHTCFVKEGIRVNPLKEFILKIKEDFARQNGIKSSDIKTTIKDSRKNIVFEPSDLLYSGQVPEKKVDIVLLNSGKLADFSLFHQKTAKLFSKIAAVIGNTRVIMEISHQFELKPENCNAGEYKTGRIIAGSPLPGRPDDSHASLALYNLEGANEEEKPSESATELSTLFETVEQYTKEQIKKEVKKINPSNLTSDKELLQYARLLSYAGLYSKAFDILKEIFASDYALSYTILKEIETECKNKKLALRAGRFIIDNKIKEKGFSAELLDAIVGEIDDYLEEHEDSILNETDWL